MIRDALRALLGWSKPPALPLTPAMPPKGSCVECGAPGAHAAHLVPRVVGGTRTFTLCEACHGKSHGLDFHDHKQLVKAGLRRVKEEGRHVGQAPFGFKHGREPGYLVECPREQFVLARAMSLKASGKTWEQVTEVMNRSEATRHPSGRPWRPSTLRNLFTAPRIAIRERARRVCDAHP